MDLCIIPVEAQGTAANADSWALPPPKSGARNLPMPESYTVTIPADALDVSVLPPNARQPGTEAFQRAVSELLAGDLMAFGLDGQIAVTAKSITVKWQDTGRATASVERAVELLRSGDYKRGIRLLQILETLEPNNPHLHFNLGAALSDRGRFEEARAKLRKAIELAPDFVDAHTTLGLTFAREGRHEEAVQVFEAALAKAPKNPYLWRALGGTLRLMSARLPEALEALRKAANLAPADPVTWLGLAEVTEKLEKWDEASEAYRKCRDLNPPDAIAHKAEQGINRMTARSLRPKDMEGREMLRMDAILYMQEALPIFARMSPEELKQAALELAMAGQNGLDLKDPTPKFTLKNLPGNFSGMKIVSFMYAAFQQIMPGVDVGIDLSREYAAVKA